MQRLQNIFRREQTGTLVQQPAKAPTPLTAEELKKVAGGLPNVGGFGLVAPTDPTASKLG